MMRTNPSAVDSRFGVADAKSQTFRRRPGWSLIETVVAHGLLAIVMAVSGTLFVALARSERNSLRSCAAQQALSRLNEQFRRDVHQARSVEILPGETPTLKLAAADGEGARYVLENGYLTRAAKEHRETYRLPDAEWSFHIDGDAPRTVTLKLNRPSAGLTSNGGELPSRVEWRLSAALGLTAGVQP